MKSRTLLLSVLLANACLPTLYGADASDNAAAANKVYGEWRIRIKPDKGPEYNELIRGTGLPLFEQAGGRMVGWWTPLIGDLYEHITIWEYDNMAAFEKAVGFLGGNDDFKKFVAKRDPLLAGESSRFLRMPDWAAAAQLADPAKMVIHEIHRVPLANVSTYLNFMQFRGLKMLKEHGFRPVGPWTVEVGKWSEVTYLFRFDSLAERERLIAEFGKHPDAAEYSRTINPLVDEISTTLLRPAPFLAAAKHADNKTSEVPSSLLPHLEQLAPDVFASGFSDRYNSANCGWVTLDEGNLLIDLPRGVEAADYVAEVRRITGKPVRRLALTSAQPGDLQLVRALHAQGVEEVIASPAIRDKLLTEETTSKSAHIIPTQEKTSIGDKSHEIFYIPFDGLAANGGGAVVHVPHDAVLFAGPLVYNGPRTPLPGRDSALWISALEALEQLDAAKVVPGFGSWGGSSLLARERRFLAELRRQVGYAVAQGRPVSSLEKDVRIPADYLVWMPYDTPTPEDLDHVHRELTVPIAPFNNRPPAENDSTPHALVLIGDQPHEPGHVEAGLRPVFAATGVVPHFTVDVHALTAENLAKVDLLVVLRDGLQRPTDDHKDDYVWMTPEQQQAVVQYVENGGAFLNLHNSMGLYPDDGPYLHLVGGRYIGHGPLERFRVEVVDPAHAITRGIEGFSVADEQHTPPYDTDKVHLLLRNRSDDGKSAAAAGWAYEPGKGRLCHLANGHTRESLLHPQYQKLMCNAVNWCLRRE
ncbi:MAG: ThuA domain-containing protein [Planctomycetaceae bacterium]